MLLFTIFFFTLLLHLAKPKAISFNNSRNTSKTLILQSQWINATNSSRSKQQADESYPIEEDLQKIENELNSGDDILRTFIFNN